MRLLIPICSILYLLTSCTAKKQNGQTRVDDVPASGLSGKELSVAHCGRCHAVVGPELLTRAVWQEVLPAMGHRMGIYSGGVRPDSLFDVGLSGSLVREAGIYPEGPVLAKEDWIKLVNYYLDHAPDSIAPPLRQRKIRMGLSISNTENLRCCSAPPSLPSSKSSRIGRVSYMVLKKTDALL